MHSSIPSCQRNTQYSSNHHTGSDHSSKSIGCTSPYTEPRMLGTYGGKMSAPRLKIWISSKAHEQCLFYKTDMDGTCYCATWVDDVIIASNRRYSEIVSKLEQLVSYQHLKISMVPWHCSFEAGWHNNAIPETVYWRSLKRFNMQSANKRPPTTEIHREDSRKHSKT